VQAPEEPLRNKTHWDSLLEEMVWLSTDFQNERKWKHSIARKAVHKAASRVRQRHNQQLRAVREAELALRRISHSMARGVMRFWQQIEKLVDYKQQALLDTRKKKSMSKHLDFLVGQTEQYSSMLAANLGAGAAAGAANRADDSDDDTGDDDEDDDDDSDDEYSDVDEMSDDYSSFEAHPATKQLLLEPEPIDAVAGTTADDDDDEYQPEVKRPKREHLDNSSSNNNNSGSNHATVATTKQSVDPDADVDDKKAAAAPPPQQPTSTARNNDSKSADDEDNDIDDDESTIAAAEREEGNERLSAEAEKALLERDNEKPLPELLVRTSKSKRDF
jgi:hypothetical protein